MSLYFYMHELTTNFTLCHDDALKKQFLKSSDDFILHLIYGIAGFLNYALCVVLLKKRVTKFFTS